MELVPPDAPRPPAGGLRVTVIDDAAAALESAGELVGADLAGVDLTGVEMRGGLFEDCRGSGLRLDAAKLTLTSFMNLALERASFSNVDAHRSGWHRVRLAQSRLTGTNLAEASLKDVDFAECRLDLINLRNAEFKRVRFTQCDLREADFAGAKLADVTFDNCQLDGSEWSGATMRTVELRSCSMQAIRGLTGLRGAAMPWPDLMSLAANMASELGIRILDTRS